MDGGARDASRPDLPPPRPCLVEILDSDESEWPSLAGCGPVSASQTVARGGAFDQLARESPETCGRAPQIAGRRLRVESGRLALTEEQVIAAAAPNARGLAAAARGEQLIVAAGVEWTAFSGSWGSDDAGTLAMVPEPVPGCIFRLDAKDLLPLPSGWLVTFDAFDCDVGVGQVRFYDAFFEPTAAPMDRFPGIGGATAVGEGALLVGKARPEVETTLTFLDPAGSETRTEILDTGGLAVAVDRWPSSDDGLAVAFLGLDPPTVRLRILDAEGRVMDRSNTAIGGPELELYLPISIDVATTDFGLVVAVGFEWGGGRIDTATAILAFDRRGTALMEPAVAADLGGATPAISVAGAGPHAVVTAFSSTVERATGRSTLVGCSP